MNAKMDESFVSALSEAAARYERDGVAVLRGVFDEDEMAELTQESEWLWETQEGLVPQNFRVDLRTDTDGNLVLDRLDPVSDRSQLFYEFNQDPRLLAIAEACLGEEPRVMKDKLIYKRPGTQGFGAHRDGPYFDIGGIPHDELVSIMVPLDPATAASGATAFYPTLRDVETPAPPGEPRDVAEEALDAAPEYMPELEPGDVVFFDGRIPHRSAANTSDRSRRIYMPTYTCAKYGDARMSYYKARLNMIVVERAGKIPGPYFLK